MPGEIVWQDAFTTEMLKNKKNKDNLYVFVGYISELKIRRRRVSATADLVEEA